MTSRLVVRTDGGARGNPGPSAAGVAIYTPEGRPVARFGRVLGRGTNNEAEYQAMILGLEAARKLGAGEVDVFTDSELMQRQIAGRYKVKTPHLKPLYERVMALLRSFETWSVRHVRREENAEPDRLANLALDMKSDVDEEVGG